jgi:hypothetical protein
VVAKNLEKEEIKEVMEKIMLGVERLNMKPRQKEIDDRPPIIPLVEVKEERKASRQAKEFIYNHVHPKAVAN